MGDDDTEAGPDAPAEPAEEKPLFELIDDDYGTKIIAHINSKAVLPNDACAVCGSPNNRVQPLVFKVDSEPIPDHVFGAHRMPLFSTICFNCGFVRFFNRFVVDKILNGEPLPVYSGDVGGEDAAS